MSSKTEDNILPKEKEPTQTREKEEKADPKNVRRHCEFSQSVKFKKSRI